MENTQIILASSSTYRQSILKKLCLPFKTFSPNVDESILKNEDARSLVIRLSLEKANAGIEKFSDALIIGSDQICVINNHIYGKPHTKENAIKQLSLASNNKVTFHTGLTLINSKTKQIQSEVETFHVYFRKLSLSEIEAYIDKDSPFNCAGSFKSEGLGISLFKKLEGRDPNTLIGLPLILLCEMLRNENISI